MSLDYTTKCAAWASQSFDRASAHKKQNKNNTGHSGSGGQLRCRLMLLTEDLFIQGNGCPSLFPRPWGKEMHSMMLCRGGGTTSITAKARPRVWRQRGAELTPPGRLPLRTGEVAISIRVRPDSCYKRSDWWRASSSGATTITSGSILTKEMSSWWITNAIDTDVEAQIFKPAASKKKIQKRFLFSSTVYFSEVTWCENRPASHLTTSCWNLINDYLKLCPVTAKSKNSSFEPSQQLCQHLGPRTHKMQNSAYQWCLKLTISMLLIVNRVGIYSSAALWTQKLKLQAPN